MMPGASINESSPEVLRAAPLPSNTLQDYGRVNVDVAVCCVGVAVEDSAKIQTGSVLPNVHYM